MLDKKECNYLDTARFIGMYLVVFGHVALIYEYRFISYMIYSFHMPLFFMISGILHKQQRAEKKNILKTIYSLLIPFMLYNVLCFLYLFVERGEAVFEGLEDILLGLRVVSGASWFIWVLFWIKFLSLFLRSKAIYVILSLVFLGGILLIKYFCPSLKNYYLFQSVLFSFPFFTVGYCLRDKLEYPMKKYMKCLFIVIGVVLCYLTTEYVGSISVVKAAYSNLFVNCVVAVMVSVSLVFFSQLVTPYVKYPFVRDVSRGTMIIVGLHSFIMYQVFPDIFFGPKALRVALLLSVVLFLAFYPIIKMTYNTMPILYGKRKGTT